MAAPAPIRRAEGFYRELELVRIQWSQPDELGLAVASAAAREAAAGVRARSGLALGGTAGRTGGRARLLEGC